MGPDHLNLRGGPGTIHSKLDTLAPGTELRVLNRSGQTGWLHVALADGRKGYVFDQFLRTEDPVKPASQIVESVEEDVVNTEIVTRPVQPEWETNQPEEDFWLPPAIKGTAARTNSAPQAETQCGDRQPTKSCCQESRFRSDRSPGSISVVAVSLLPCVTSSACVHCAPMRNWW